MFENPRRGRQARNFTTNVPIILDPKSSSEQIFSENWRWVPLFICTDFNSMNLTLLSWRIQFVESGRHCHLHVMKETSRLQLPRQTMHWRMQHDTYHLSNHWFWPIFYFVCETSTWHLDSCPSEDTWYGVILWVLRVLGYFSPEFSLVVTSYWRAPKRAKQLSMALQYSACRI